MRTKTVKEKGREEKGSEKRVSIVVSFRVSKEEAKKLQKEADGMEMSLSEWARETLLGCEEGHQDGRQGRLDFSEEEEEVERDAAKDMEEFLSAVARSARGLASGWVRAKMLPKLERRRKKAALDTTDLVE